MVILQNKYKYILTSVNNSLNLDKGRVISRTYNLMRKYFFCFIIIIIFTSLVPSPTYAQNQPTDDADIITPNILPEGVESCFQYFEYAKVKVNFSEDKNNYQPNDKIRLRGTIVNNNTFPLANVILYSQLKRINNVPKSQSDNGDYLIDRITLVNDLGLLPHETKYLDVEIPLLTTYPAGDYRLEYFILSKEGFHYSGRAFLENDVAGITSFAVKSSIPQIYFDINNFKVNGNKTNLREFGRVYNSNSFSFEMPIVDERSDKSDLAVNVKYYYFEDDLENLLEKTETLTVKSNDQILRTNFSIPANLAAAYMVVAEIDTPAKTIIKYRFYKEGAISKQLQVNDLGITDYPLVDSSKAFVCFYSPANVSAPETTVKLTLLDENNSELDTKSVNAAFPGDVLAFSLPLSKLTSKNNFFIKTNLTDSFGTREIVRHFSDNLFNGSQKSINIVQNTTDPGIMTITIKDINGNTINNNTYLDAVRVIDSQGKVVQEQDAVTDLTTPFRLGNLPKGKYTIEAQSGNIKTSNNFELSKDYNSKDIIASGYMNTKTQAQAISKNSQKQTIYVAILFILLFTILGFGVYFVHKKNKMMKL